MTFCLGIRVRTGLVALADTKIVRGEEYLTRGKLTRSLLGGHPWWVMTSGLRSVRDKAVTYLDLDLQNTSPLPRQLFEVVNGFGKCLRRVRDEDAASLAAGGFTFNLHAILGGRLDGDPSPKMFLVYPEGNWIESTDDSPYFMIGRTAYAKPILERLLRYDTSLEQAVGLAFLAFDATRLSVNDVDFPVDIMVLPNEAKEVQHQRYTADQLRSVADWWQSQLAASLEKLPYHRFDALFRPNQSSEATEHSDSLPTTPTTNPSR